jgi:predicted HD superfamily hydrolase involved in NAD metabolism
MGVEGMAVLLAAQHGVCTEKVLLAALLHDYCKAEPRQRLEEQLAGANDFPLSVEDREHPAVWHGLAAAEMALQEFGIDDAEIREAVAWHPTGGPGMGPVGLVLFVADFLEPSRDFPGVSERRAQWLGLPLEQAAHAIAREKIAVIERRGHAVHSRTRAMADWLAGRIRQPATP